MANIMSRFETVLDPLLAPSLPEALQETPQDSVNTASKCPFSQIAFSETATAQKGQRWEEAALHTLPLVAHLLTPAEVENEQTVLPLPPSSLAALRETLKWTREFIMRPHPQLGRSGSVCPFVKPAMKEGLLYLSPCSLKNPEDTEAIYREIMGYESCFRQIQERLGPEAGKLLTILIVMPDMSDELAVQLMEPLHQRIKTDILGRGIMIGQFYPSCPVPATWNSEFRPLQSPVPMFVLRQLIETDLRFMAGNPDWEERFHRHFEGNKLPL
jgi:hypothetical protein